MFILSAMLLLPSEWVYIILKYYAFRIYTFIYCMGVDLLFCNVSWIIIIGLCRFTSSHPSCDVFKRVFNMIHSFISAHSTSSSLFNCLTKLESILLYCFHIKPRRVNRREVKLSLEHQINKVEDEKRKTKIEKGKVLGRHRTSAFFEFIIFFTIN